MIAVADTSLLNYLILLGRADLLPGLFPRILVPPAVLSELRDPNAPPAVRAWAFQPPVWFEVVPVREIDEGLPSQFGAGEREALSLALETHADILLIDERREGTGRSPENTRDWNSGHSAAGKRSRTDQYSGIAQHTQRPPLSRFSGTRG